MGECLTGCDSCPSKSTCAGRAKQKTYPEIQASFKDKKVLCVMSGKGGVGKSTLAYAIAKELSNKCSTTLIDTDIAGPSIPRITGTDRSIIAGDTLIPQEVENLQVITPPENLFMDGYTPGLSISYYLSMVKSKSDFIVIDTPPGSSDVHISLVKSIPNMQAILITTGHPLSLSDVARSVQFCNSAKLSIIGVIESMSKGLCSKCGSTISIFPSNLVESFCKERNIPFLQSIPLLQSIAQSSDNGISVNILKESTVLHIYEKLLQS